MPTVFVALPAYNEEASLPPLLEHFVELELPEPWEMRMLIVDDGSADRTAELARSFADRLNLEVIEHGKNRGLGPAIKTGLQAALDRSESPDEDLVVCMDADNTHHPRYVHDMLPLIAEGADLVIASRYRPGSEERGVPAIRRLYSRGARLLFWMTLRLPGVRDYTCGYRAYRTALLRRGFEAWGDDLIEGDGFACTDELLVKLARLDPAPSIREIPFILRYDLKEGESKLPLFKTILGTLKLCFGGKKH